MKEDVHVNASMSIIIAQHCIFWLLMLLLLACVVVFAWLAFRPDPGSKRSEFVEPLISEEISAVPTVVHAPVRMPVVVGVNGKEGV